MVSISVVFKLIFSSFTLLLLAACSAPQTESPSLRICFNRQPSTLDPAHAGDFVSSTLICMIYEGLTRCHPQGGVEPALAERVEISPDGTIYLFHLRQARWSDGHPITALDFEKAWKKVIDAPSASAYLFYPIKNGEKCAKKELPIDQLGVRALSATTLRVELEHPTPYFYSLTAFPNFLPAPSHTTDPQVCSGPFQIQKMAQNAEIILTQNGAYWNQDQVDLGEIHISIIPDEMTALHLFERGELDWLGGTLSPLPPDALDQGGQKLIFVPCAASTFVSFNTEKGPFQNAHLRKAFSLAIDRAEIVEKVVPVGQIPATRLLPPSLLRGEPLVPLFDPTAARLHFAQAMEELSVLPSLTLYYKPTQIDKRLAQALQRGWQETLGVTVHLVQLDFKSHAHRLQRRDYEMSLASWIAQFDDPICLLERFKDKGNAKNYAGWEEPEYARLLTEAATSAHRLELMKEAEALLAEHMPFAPIYHWRSPALCSPRLEQIGLTPCGGILFERFKPSKP